MHQSFVTTPQPLGRAGDSWANVPWFYFCIVPIVQGKCRIFYIPRQTWQCNVKQTAGEKPELAVPQCGGYSRELQTKSQSPRSSPELGEGGGGWLQMTSALHQVYFGLYFIMKSNAMNPGQTATMEAV